MGNVINLDPLIHRICDGVQNFAWELAVKHAAYVYNLQDNLQTLEESLEDLQTKKKELKRRIQNKLGHRMQMGEKVGSWIPRVEKQIDRGEQLKKEGDRHLDSLCLAGICSTHYFSTSAFGGHVVKCVKDLNTLKTVGEEFTEEDLVVNAPTELELGDEMPCDSVGLEDKLAEVLTFLNEENVGILGVYGQGGVGKTTLLKEINNHYVSRSENFLVVWIDVPKDVNLQAIQQAIGKKIGVPDELESMEEKASYIFKALRKKKIILLLDDIRKAINLSDIGIPPSNSLKDSKVVFTTRPKHVCTKMEPQPGKTTSIETLEEEQAWQLFVKRVGVDILNSPPQILQLAKTVAKKCGGLPLALTIIGKAMFGETDLEEWKRIVNSFERLDSTKELFSILRYSYDSLPNETYKSCFLLCAAFPEAIIFHKLRIVKYLAFGDVSTDCNEDDPNADPYAEAHRILNVLANSSLLEIKNDWVKIHDVVRSMALWIAKEDTLVMSGVDLEEAPDVGTWKQMKRVSLMGTVIKELTQVPECPHLLPLFLSDNEQLKEIRSGFFESMCMLTILDLSHTEIKELPESISKLVSLKYLNLSYTRITELPVVLTELKALVYLDVAGVQSLRLRRKSQIFRHLSSLQYLGMKCQYYYCEREEDDEIRKTEGNDEILLEELLVLRHLKVLEIKLGSMSGLMKLFNNSRLLKITRSLELSDFKGAFSIDIALLTQLKYLDTVNIELSRFEELTYSHGSNDAILPSSTSSRQMPSFNSITTVNLIGCDYLKDITCVGSLLYLIRLAVVSCDELREIISREKIEKDGEIFSSLTTLELVYLPRLRSIYPSNTLSLRFLSELRVEDCRELKKLPLDPNNGVLGCSKIKLMAEQEWWDGVQWEDDDAKAALLPRFNLNILR